MMAQIMDIYQAFSYTGRAGGMHSKIAFNIQLLPSLINILGQKNTNCIRIKGGTRFRRIFLQVSQYESNLRVFRYSVVLFSLPNAGKHGPDEYGEKRAVPVT